jgi:formylglycine-generating enzyme required for sulfatase activity
MRDRLAVASTIEEKSISMHREAWDSAVASIANRKECPQYEGLILEPQVGFVPIDRDRDSGLWEFVHLQTGDIPKRRFDGGLELAEGTGLVFVLVPGGTFSMGAVLPSEEAPLGSPNVDPDAESIEGPVRSVTVPPFFMSKYEMTRAQWLRFIRMNRDPRDSEKETGEEEVPSLFPVERVSWEDCVEVLRCLGLRLPSESEWEYAARAGTSTVWWTGNDKKSLIGAANLRDRSRRTSEGNVLPHYEDWMDDGYSGTAPVGTFRPNPFGLHDVCGNVNEWCRDCFGDPENRPEDGSAFESPFYLTRVARGCSWIDLAVKARSSMRGSLGPTHLSLETGLRPAYSLE